MGYETAFVDEVRVAPGEQTDAGLISIDPTTLLMEGVAVEGEKPAITFEIDKKWSDPL